MMLYIWQHRDSHYAYYMSKKHPERCQLEDVLNNYLVGDLIVPPYTVMGLLPTELQILPKGHEILAIGFHDLWGMAQELPTYDKKLWTELQGMLGL